MEIPFIHKSMYYVGCIIVDFYIVCNSFYIYKIWLVKLVEILKKTVWPGNSDRGAPLHWFKQFFLAADAILLSCIFPLFLFETYYQYLRLIHYHIRSKEGGSKKQPNSSREGICQYLVMIYVPTIEICLWGFMLGQVQPPAAALAWLRWWFSASLAGLLLQLSPAALPARCHLPAPADTEAMFTHMSRRADFTRASSVWAQQWLCGTGRLCSSSRVTSHWSKFPFSF